MTLYTGARLNNSTEVLVDIEEAGGAALSTGLGLAGNTDLDIVRNPLLSKAPYLGRGMIHKVFALSDDKVENQRNAFSLFDELPRRRLELRFGKFSMPDFFDMNSVGSDTHFQFLNWTIDNNGAWDYAADTRGYTVGFTADYEDRNWGIPFRRSSHAQGRQWNRPGLEAVAGPRGKFRIRTAPRRDARRKRAWSACSAYTNYANMGIYRDQVIQAADRTRHARHHRPSLAHHAQVWIRHQRWNRISLATSLPSPASDGTTARPNPSPTPKSIKLSPEGVGANGAWWHRKQDRAGIAFVSNAIKKDHQNYLAAGGLGFLLGDGQLNYGRENILETYYTVHVWRGIYLAPGLQHINQSRLQPRPRAGPGPLIPRPRRILKPCGAVRCGAGTLARCFSPLQASGQECRSTQSSLESS